MSNSNNNRINKLEESSNEERDVDVLSEESDERDEEMSFEEMFNQSLHEKSITVGEIVKGVIVGINNDEVLVDVGYKSEGVVPIRQFDLIDGKIDYNVGDEIEVVIERKEDESGQVRLSKERADKLREWSKITDAFEKQGTVEGKIIKRVKGGFSVSIKGVPAFLPASQVFNRPVKDLNQFVGKTYTFSLLEFNKEKGNIILSRKALLEVEDKEQKDILLNKIEEGAILDGIVKNLTDYGVFVDLGSIDGLLHITDISWGRVSHPSDIFNVGDKIKVVVLKYDKNKQRISLGRKQIFDDPWKKATEKYPVGSKVKGKVVTLVEYGAFVEIEDGIEGLIHISEMSWTKNVKHPSKVLSVGDVVETAVLNIDVPNKRLSLGLKQVEDNPWDTLADKYPVGTIVERKVKNVTDFGVFVEFEEGIDGLIHISDISWNKKYSSIKEDFHKGDLVKAKILEINAKTGKCSLSIKNLSEDPWKNVEKKYKKGSIATGVVTSITEYGAFVQLEDDVEGLVHISELKADKNDNAPDHMKVGEEVKVIVTNISRQNKKIGLSVKDLEKKLERDEINKYLANQGGVTAKLMDFVKPADIKKVDSSIEKSADSNKNTESKA